MRAAAVEAGPAPVRGQWAVALVGAGMLAIGASWLGAGSWRLASLFLLGGLFGVTLYHAAFGFTGAYRRALVERDVSGVVAQLVMLALAMVLFAPILAAGEVFGRPVGGAVAPVGLRVAVGAFLFGLGMQLGGGCGSGTLFTAGGGSLRMVVTLAAFCAGAFLGSLDAPRWAGTWMLGSVSLGRELGFGAALALQLVLLGSIWLGLWAWGRGAPQTPLWRPGVGRRQLLVGPWPLLLGAVLLALGNLATLLIAGHAWSITWGFTLWGAELAALLGWEPGASAFWASGFGARALESGIFADVTSLMDIGIVLGALTAAGMAGRFAPSTAIPARALIAAVLGGLAMGYGARLAFGCNIGAFFSGVASFSLHGWVWIVFAVGGTWLGVRLRPWFALSD